ncbi:nitrogenase molybdenum-iron protein [Butyrivibrio fibrisolvens]|uniref:nitrogenase component 1 n=1 Tax=Pseudobutyrivibrio ruminis TaxID=46206 RepID=UPI000424D17B|nr:nitrogenase component 1 [Pseudobutyrivibrio ruminis]MDC7278474.1 nitrogenase molybdenum-iron protein [Butyrivibrio fibrisolvens]
MANIIKNPRNGCALHGALQTVQEIQGVVPVVHANASCGVINYLANSKTSGGNPRFSGYSTPGTAAQERHVIFGGASRLREQIKNTVKVVDGSLYIILNSCESAMVGDDVDAMTREIVEQGEPVVDTLIAGFNGSAYYGYEHVLADIFKSVYELKKNEGEKNPRLVNIFGIIPQKDPYWQGNLEEITRILNGVGLETNIFFGADGGTEDIENARNAALSITFGRWGELPAKVLNEKFEIPVIQRAALPINADDERALIEGIEEYITIDQETKEHFLEKEQKYELNYWSRVRDEIIENDLGRTVAIVGEEEHVIRLGKLVQEVFGAEVVAAVLTDALKKDEEHTLDNEEVLNSIAKNIYKTSDQKDINDIIRQSKAELVIGSSLEQHVADKHGIPLVEASYPVYHKTILNHSSIGVRGIVGVIAEYITAVKQADKEKEEKLQNKLKELKGQNVWLEHSYKKSHNVKQVGLVSQGTVRESI